MCDHLRAGSLVEAGAIYAEARHAFVGENGGLLDARDGFQPCRQAPGFGFVANRHDENAARERAAGEGS